MSNDSLIKLINVKKQQILELLQDTLSSSVLDGNREMSLIKRLEHAVHEDVNFKKDTPLLGFVLTIKEKIHNERLFFLMSEGELCDFENRLRDADLTIDWQLFEKNNKSVYIKLVKRHTKHTPERTILGANRRYPHPAFEKTQTPKKPKS